MTLDEAWKEAEAALPKAGWVDPMSGKWVVPETTWAITIRWVDSGDGYFEPHYEGYEAVAKLDAITPFALRGDLGDTPTAALQALRAALDQRQQQPEEQA